MNFSMDFYLRLSIPHPSGHAFSPLPILKGNPNNIQKETELKLICRRKLLTSRVMADWNSWSGSKQNWRIWPEKGWKWIESKEKRQKGISWLVKMSWQLDTLVRLEKSELIVEAQKGLENGRKTYCMIIKLLHLIKYWR